MEKRNNYDLVLMVVKSWDKEEVLEDFKNKFKEGKNIKKKDYMII